jgi:hypothetical protein
MESDGGDTERNRATKSTALAIPKREAITFGFMTCARAAGKSVRECACKLKTGGWLECPPEFIGVLARPEAAAAQQEWTAKLSPVMLSTVFTPPDALDKLVVPYPVLPRRPDPEPIGELGTVPKTPEQIRAAVMSERAHLANMARAAGYTGNLCDGYGGSKMRRNGTCERCDDCGATSGCS